MGHIRVPRLILLCGFEYDRPGEVVWCAKSRVRLTAYAGHGVPFGRSRAILLFLAQKAAISGRFVRGSLYEIRDTFNPKWRIENLEKHMLRVINCVYERIEPHCSHVGHKCDRRRELDVFRQKSYCSRSKTFKFEIGDDLLANEHNSFPCSWKRVARLVGSEQYQCLDVFLFYRNKHARKDRTPVDPLGPEGPFGLAPIAKDPGIRRQLVNKHHSTIVGLWPGCPYRLVARNGRLLIVYAPHLPHPDQPTSIKRKANPGKKKRKKPEKAKRNRGETRRSSRRPGRPAPSRQNARQPRRPGDIRDRDESRRRRGSRHGQTRRPALGRTRHNRGPPR